MIKNLKKIRTTFFLGLLFISLFIYLTPQTEAKDPVYNAWVDVDLKWNENLTDKPIIPRDEIVELGMTVIFEIKTGETFGEGLLNGAPGPFGKILPLLLKGYKNSATALIDLYIVDFPSWCSATLEKNRFETPISEREQASATMFVHINENAPAFTNGSIKVEVIVKDLGLIKGDSQVFDLPFKPAYFPVIKTDLPEMNSKRIDPNSEATFPIEIENAGNARTKVFLKVLNVPDDWSATVTDSIILGKSKGSKNTAYLTISPSRSVGYHYDEANIVVEILPAMAEDISFKGKPIYANFLIQNRGLSTAGFELYVPIGIVILIIFVIIGSFFIKNLKKNKSKS